MSGWVHREQLIEWSGDWCVIGFLVFRAAVPIVIVGK